MQASSSNIFEAFQPLWSVLSAFGFVPFRMNVRQRTIHERSVHYSLFFAFVYGVWFVVACYIGQQQAVGEESLLTRYGTYLLYICSNLSVVFVVLFNYSQRRTFASCILIMDRFDFDCAFMASEQQRKQESNDKPIQQMCFNAFLSFKDSPSSSGNSRRWINHSRQRLIVCFFIVKSLVMFMIEVGEAIYFLEKAEHDAKHYASICFNALFMALLAMGAYQLTFFSFCIKHRYAAFVELFELRLSDLNYKCRRSNSQRKVQLIEDLADLHMQMTDALKAANAAFSAEVKVTRLCEASLTFYHSLHSKFQY